MRALVIGLLSGCALFAQVSGLATTDDGSVLLFSTTLRLRGVNDGNWPKIYKWDGAFSEVFSFHTPVGQFRPTTVSQPVISGDGSVFGYGLTSLCVSLCPAPPYRVIYKGPGIDINSFGVTPVVSRNGRFVVSGLGYIPQVGIERIDLTTGEVAGLGADGGSPLGVTDAGAVLIRTDDALSLATSGSRQRLVEGDVETAAISADGTRVVYSVEKDGAFEIRTGSTLLAVSPAAVAFHLSNDGSRLLVRDGTAAWWMDLNSMQRRDLGPTRSGAAVLAGNGRVAWLVEPDGRLARVVLDTGGETGDRLYVGEPTPQITGVIGAPVRGSLNRLLGTGFDRTSSWTVELIGGNGDRLSLLRIDSPEPYFDFQIPWDLPLDLSASWIGVGRAGSIFESVTALTAIPEIYQPVPEFWVDDPNAEIRIVKAAHADYQSLVTPENPARPGELVHAYATGLGPVSPVQENFEPLPAGQLARIVTPIECRLHTQNTTIQAPVEVEYAGLAPTMVGVYLLELRMPQSWQDPVDLVCQMPGRGRVIKLPVAQ